MFSIIVIQFNTYFNLINLLFLRITNKICGGIYGGYNVLVLFQPRSLSSNQRKPRNPFNLAKRRWYFENFSGAMKSGYCAIGYQKCRNQERGIGKAPVVISSLFNSTRWHSNVSIAQPATQSVFLPRKEE